MNWTQELEECSRPTALPAGDQSSVQVAVERRRRVPLLFEWQIEAVRTEGSMDEKADMEMAENPFEPYIESVRQQLEDQDPVFLIGVIVALAVVVITCGKNFTKSFLLALA